MDMSWTVQQIATIVGGTVEGDDSVAVQGVAPVESAAAGELTFAADDKWAARLASSKAGDWIAQATRAVLGNADLGLDVCLTYLPTLDYDLQRFGPAGPQA